MKYVSGDVFEYPQSYIPLQLSCVGSECGINNTELAIQCRFNNNCMGIFWKENDTCYFCKCQTEPLHAMPLDMHDGSEFTWEPLDRLPGKFSLIYYRCIQVFINQMTQLLHVWVCISVSISKHSFQCRNYCCRWIMLQMVAFSSGLLMVSSMGEHPSYLDNLGQHSKSTGTTSTWIMAFT